MINYVIAVSAIIFVVSIIVKGIRRPKAKAGVVGGCGFQCSGCSGGCHTESQIVSSDGKKIL